MPTLCDTIHWLPVWQRINYKIATMAFRCVQDACLTYFTEASVPVNIVAGRAKLSSARHGTSSFRLLKRRHLAVKLFALLPLLSGTVRPLIVLTVTLINDNL